MSSPETSAYHTALWGAFREHGKECSQCAAALAEADHLGMRGTAGKLFPCELGTAFVATLIKEGAFSFGPEAWAPLDINGLTALTFWPEWIPCFTTLDKRTENRTWPPPDRLIGQDFVLHAGKSIGGGSFKKGAKWLKNTADNAGWWVELTPGKPPIFSWLDVDVNRQPVVLGAAVCVARLVGADQEMKTSWDMEDQWHWRLEDIRVLPSPIPMRGRQGLFTVDLETRKQMPKTPNTGTNP